MHTAYCILRIDVVLSGRLSYFKEYILIRNIALVIGVDVGVITGVSNIRRNNILS